MENAIVVRGLVILSAATLAMLVLVVIGIFTDDRFKRWRRVRQEARKPRLVTLGNNGLFGLALKADWEALRNSHGVTTLAWGALMLFASKAVLEGRWMLPSAATSRLTGNWKDYQLLEKYCHVEFLPPFGMYIPFTSGLASQTWDEENFPRVPWKDACRRIFGKWVPKELKRLIRN